MAAAKQVNREAAARGGRKSSRKGIPNKVTQDLVARLNELGCDPLELSAKIAIGEELDGPHPALKLFNAFVTELQAAITGDGDLAAMPDRLQALVDEHLTRGYVPIDLRSKHIADLMQYTYPKRKAIEVDASITDDRAPVIDPTKLSDKALREIVGAMAGNIVEGEVVDG